MNMQEYPYRNFSHTDFILIGLSGPTEWKRLLSIPFALMFIVSIAANSMLIYIIMSERALHTPMCILIGVMAFIDFIMPIFFVPNILLSLLFNLNSISLTGCLLQMFFFHFFGTFQSTILLWMALDRYFAICLPLRYNEHMALSNFQKFVIPTVTRNAILISAIVILARPLSFCLTNEINHCFCEHMALVSLACGKTTVNSIVGLVAVFSITTADFLLITGSYIKIFISVFKSDKSPQKALNTCITHIIIMTVTVTFALTGFLSYRVENSLSSDSRIAISTMYLLFPSCFNPIIYGVRTKEIRRHILKAMNCGKIAPLA